MCANFSAGTESEPSKEGGSAASSVMQHVPSILCLLVTRVASLHQPIVRLRCLPLKAAGLSSCRRVVDNVRLLIAVRFPPKNPATTGYHAPHRQRLFRCPPAAGGRLERSAPRTHHIRGWCSIPRLLICGFESRHPWPPAALFVFVTSLVFDPCSHPSTSSRKTSVHYT